jgi:high-affinity nickel-transport protein
MMAGMLRRLFDDEDNSIRHKARALLGLLVLFNVLVWALAFYAFHEFPLLLGTAFLAYSFGLRHAVDADHIAAIDNVTRKLMQEGRRPLSVGLMFALGHSTVVVVASVLIAVAAFTFQQHLSGFREVGGSIGRAVSSLFLLAVALMNVSALRSLYASLKALRRGEQVPEADTHAMLGQGPLARLFRPVLRSVSRSWHMYPLGLLFGLGFDTATEIGLLGIAASEATRGLPVWSIMVFPLLFTAGMALIDTADGILMLGAYGWAFVKPVRKIYYNLSITLVSVVIAAVIGGIEGLGLLADKFQLRGGFWDGLMSINANLGSLGFAVIVLFVFAWVLSMGIYKLRRFDELEPDISRSE